MEKSTKRIATLLGASIFMIGLLTAFEIAVSNVKRKGAWSPDYEKKDIIEVLGKESLSEEDYALLYEQTGLTRLGVDGLLEKGRTHTILQIQDRYFEEGAITFNTILPYIIVGKRDSFGVLCALEDGDIIISASTSAFGIKVGHAALVVDGDEELVLESIQIGYDSSFADAVTETDMSTYMVLRPTGIPVSVREDVAEYAKRELVGVPYNQIVGLIPKKFDEEIKSTQCSHLCWYAYKKFGYDLDSDGGWLVKPRDIANSPYLEVVQIFGFEPEKLWK